MHELCVCVCVRARLVSYGEESVQNFPLYNVYLPFPLTLIADAEPKYLVAVQPIPMNDVKKHCTGAAQTPPRDRTRTVARDVLGNVVFDLFETPLCLSQERSTWRNPFTWWSARSARPRCSSPGGPSWRRPSRATSWTSAWKTGERYQDPLERHIWFLFSYVVVSGQSFPPAANGPRVQMDDRWTRNGTAEGFKVYDLYRRRKSSCELSHVRLFSQRIHLK